jgi:hypothetical protein
MIDHLRGQTLKVDNGLIISWETPSINPDTPQVKIYDREGTPVASLRVLQPAIEASRASIYDVSARPGGLIAVATVYRSKKSHVRPVSSLLLFDFDGRLQSGFTLEPARTISRLEVDEDSHIWALTDHAENHAPTATHLLVEYSAKGEILREDLPRNMFPYHAQRIREEQGRAQMGYDAGRLWFWLPGTSDLVTIPTRSGAIVRVQLPMLEEAGQKPTAIFSERSGNAVTQVHDDAHIADFVWETSSKTWVRFTPGHCGGGQLIGVSGDSLVYLVYRADGAYDNADICTVPAP